MNGISAWLYRIICAAFVCALMGALGADGPGKSLRRLMAGLVLAMTVLSPLEDPVLLLPDLGRIQADAQAVTAAGVRQALQEKNAVITKALESYIWNKAASLGLELQVRVSLNPDSMPQSLELTGRASPLEREELLSSIVRELGVKKEAVKWIDPYQSSE